MRAANATLSIMRRGIEQGLVVPIAFFAVLMAIYIVRTPGSLTGVSLRYAVVNASLALTLAATGLAFVVLVGGLDLSLGGLIAAANALLTVHYGGGTATQLGWLVLTVVLGGAVGAANGLIVHHFDLEPVVVTLATGFVLTGAALWLLPAPAGLQPVQGTPLVTRITESVVGIPIGLIWMVLVGVAWVAIRRGRLGARMIAIGSDVEAAEYSGVPVGRTRVAAFALAGVLYAMAGIAVTAQTTGGDSQLGASYLLGAFAAVVIGGMRLGGGFGSLIGVILGAVALTVSVNVLLALGFGTYWSTIARGVLLLLAIGFQGLVIVLLRRATRSHAPIAVAPLDPEARS